MNLTGELLFRIAFSALWIIFFPNAAWVRSLAGVSIGKRVARHAGWSQVAALALAVPYFVGALLYALVPDWISLLLIPFPDWFRFFMLCAAVVGMSFAVWGLRVLGKNWAPSMTGVRKDTVLITTGPYSIVRNPIYLGALIFLPSLALVAASWLTVLPALILSITLYTQVGEEEATLVDRFGDAYIKFMKRTPRLIPKLRQTTAPQSKDSENAC